MDLIPPKRVSLANQDTQSTVGCAPQALSSHTEHIIDVHVSVVGAAMVAARGRAKPDARVTAAVPDLFRSKQPRFCGWCNVGGSMVVVDRAGGIVNRDVAETELDMGIAAIIAAQKLSGWQ